MASDSYHESPDLLSDETRNMHRALVSLMEELEAIDWYGQRAAVCSDEQLTGVLVHNKNEEVEHAAMLMEWIRRQDAHFDAMLRKYLFSEASIVGIEKEAEAGRAVVSAIDDLGIGGMKGR